MPVTGKWLPVEDAFEQQLVERLVQDGRTFVKGLRYNLPVGRLLASVILTDAGESPVALCIAPRDADDEQMVAEVKDLMPITGSPAWVWKMDKGPMPTLPRQGQSIAAAERVS